MSSTDNFSPNDFFSISKEIEDSRTNGTLIDTSSTEFGWLRSAISRAYYAAFLSLRVSLLDSNRWTVLHRPYTDPHENLRNILFNLPPAFRPTANDFNNLRRRRNNADYDLPPRFQATLQLVEKSNKESQKIISQIQFITNYFQSNPP